MAALLRGLADTAIVVPSTDTQRIQEVHILVIHLLCELIEERLVSARTQRTSCRNGRRG